MEGELGKFILYFGDDGRSPIAPCQPATALNGRLACRGCLA